MKHGCREDGRLDRADALGDVRGDIVQGPDLGHGAFGQRLGELGNLARHGIVVAGFDRVIIRGGVLRAGVPGVGAVAGAQGLEQVFAGFLALQYVDEHLAQIVAGILLTGVLRGYGPEG